MKRFFWLALVLVIGSLLVVGCGSTGDAVGEGGGNQVEQPGEGEARDTVFLSCATATTVGPWYAYGGGFARAVTEVAPWINISPEATAASVENTRLLGTGQVDLGLSNTLELNFAREGEGAYEKAFDNIRLLVAGTALPQHIVVPENSDIYSVGDLVGKRVATGSPGSSAETSAKITLSAFGLTFDDFQHRSLAIVESVEAMRDGNLDCIMFDTSPPAAAFIDLTANMKVRFLEIPEDIRTKINEDAPFLVEAKIPGGSYDGHPDDYYVVGVTGVLCATDSLDEELAYYVTKGVMENQEIMIAAHPTADQFVKENPALNEDVIPLHPGALKYLKEIGVID